MTFIRQYLAPLIAIVIFLLALVAVSARSFLPSGLSSPAPTQDLGILTPYSPVSTVLQLENNNGVTRGI